MFDVDKIEVTEQVGLDLILPLASVLPIGRHIRWSESKLIPLKVTESLLVAAATLYGVLIGSKVKPSGERSFLHAVVASVFSKKSVTDLAKLAGDKLSTMHTEALKKDYLRASFIGLRMDLEKGEEDQIFLRSRR